jgi:hypothetical protein
MAPFWATASAQASGGSIFDTPYAQTEFELSQLVALIQTATNGFPIARTTPLPLAAKSTFTPKQTKLYY